MAARKTNKSKKSFLIQFIYARYPKRVVDALMKKAGWTDIPGIREIKLFQNLSIIATEQLNLYIEQCVEMMRECATIKEFKMKYSKEYKLYYQLDMFQDSNITS